MRNVTIEYSRTYTFSLKSQWRENGDNNWTVKLMIFHENDFVFTRDICFTYLLTIIETLYVFRCVINNNDIIIVVLWWLKTRTITKNFNIQ